MACKCASGFSICSISANPPPSLLTFTLWFKCITRTCKMGSVDERIKKNATFFFLCLLDDLRGLIRVGVGVVALISRSPGLIFQIISVSANTISKDWIKLGVIVCLNRWKVRSRCTYSFLSYHVSVFLSLFICCSISDSLFPTLIHLKWN